MTAPNRAPMLALTLAFSLALVLSGCSSTSQSDTPGAANSPEIARAYSDCLTAEGIEGVFTDDDGYVGVAVEVGPTDSPGGDSPVDLDSGPYGAYAQAEKKCSLDVPGYHSQVSADDPAQAAQLLAQSREFAACARQNGLAEFADPDAAASGKLVVPDGTTKAQFLAVVTACASSFAAGTTVTDGPGDGNEGAMTIAMPQFVGAYDASWSTEVMNILFAAAEPSASPAP